MTRQEYTQFIDSEVRNVLKDTTLASYKNQIFAWRLNASFTRSFQIDYLWNRAVFLSSSCAYLLEQDGDTRIITTGLKSSAEIFEYLSELKELAELYDKDSVLLLSALCYDLSGYQANAYCIAQQIGEFIFDDERSETSTDSESYIVRQITYILLKKIPEAKANIQAADDLGIILFDDALSKWCDAIFRLSEDTGYQEAFERVYQYYLKRHNIFISHLLSLLKTRIAVFENKSIWNTLKKNGHIAESKVWRKYVKLLAHDYYDSNSIKNIGNRRSVFELWTSQHRAIEQGLLERNENFVVQMPTSAGKTFIAELSILKNLTEFPDKKCIYVAPFRALTSEKEIELGRYFSKLGYSVSALSGSYEVDSFQDVIISQTDVLIATPEKIDMLVRINPELFKGISLMVVDEGHIIGEVSTRAALLEFLIIRLKIKFPEIAFLFISAVMPPKNADQYAQWLSGEQENVLRSLQFPDSPVTEEWEPTRKLIGSFTWTKGGSQIGFKNFEETETLTSIGKSFVPNYLMHREIGGKYPTVKTKPATTAALAYRMTFEGNTLVFCGQPRRTLTIANQLLQILQGIDIDLPEWFEADEGKESFYYTKMWYGEDDPITQSIRHGIGIHFGDMPEQVRNSVEHDYRTGRLRLLLSSNTVGQGLNFPIKNLIFYNLAIGHGDDGQILISKRDFWNIVGRAGRAGKETEGKIIFVINTPIDLNNYKEFTNRDNLEEADSLFSKVINTYNRRRINRIVRDRHLSILSETFLMEMFTEEIIGTDYEEIINDIIDNSLFKFQLDEDDLELIKRSFRSTFKKFEENLDVSDAEIYKQSGFTYDSNIIIDDFIIKHLEELNGYLEDDNHFDFCRLVFEFLLDAGLEELDDRKLTNIGLTVEMHYPIIEMWISGEPLEEIIEQWKKNKNIESFHLFLSKGLYYLYPWAFTAFTNIMIYRLGIERDDVPYNIANLSSYLKYGLPDSAGCLARSLGIKNRDAVVVLTELASGRTGPDFIKWLSNLSTGRINSLELSVFDRENIISISRKLTPHRFNALPDVFSFTVEATSEFAGYRISSRRVSEGAVLEYARVRRSNNPYAIYLLYKGHRIGRVPAEYSKVISAEIDINDTDYLVTVKEVIAHGNYNSIIVEMALMDLL
ncbi:DEAD/DEAH box helicase [Flavobacterium sp. LC2016-01]|uniref:DEAD/DEAH box helicase n=1 Tax=Flavobacterium sp. LC2016-01 TaxID=2675876 RepID=UPI0012BB1C5E|nr:DEAD/DEAH box helicase [Flavobacterium sp. LC2016-01]MTH15890.1 DEAD/DEAH box helicase [Flavobacterium sp. LC2016-01]